MYRKKSCILTHFYSFQLADLVLGIKVLNTVIWHHSKTLTVESTAVSYLIILIIIYIPGKLSLAFVEVHDIFSQTDLWMLCRHFGISSRSSTDPPSSWWPEGHTWPRERDTPQQPLKLPRHRLPLLNTATLCVDVLSLNLFVAKEHSEKKKLFNTRLKLIPYLFSCSRPLSHCTVWPRKNIRLSVGNYIDMPSLSKPIKSNVTEEL